MISKLFKRRPATPRQADATIPEGERIYAVGDIHGCLEELDRLLDAIAADELARGPSNTTLIFLGDLVDRGPDSAGVVERLRKLAETRPSGTTRFLLGNHEEVFLAALSGDEPALRFFTRIGGRETILSYAVSEEEYSVLGYPELLTLLQERVPASHVDFLSQFEDMIQVGGYAFVHAGIRPGAPLDRQRAKDLRWIREEFLGFSGALEKVIVHGHTIFEEVEQTAFRIGLDTGAYATGKLTAMGFEADRRWTLST